VILAERQFESDPLAEVHRRIFPHFQIIGFCAEVLYDRTQVYVLQRIEHDPAVRQQAE
jgi:hypothetical protein